MKKENKTTVIPGRDQESLEGKYNFFTLKKIKSFFLRDTNKLRLIDRFLNESGMTKTTYTNISNKKAFTLVELIIVITILVILGTIAFTSFQGFTKNARDSNRVASMSTIETGLEFYQIQTGKYPKPEEYENGITYTGALSLTGIEVEYSYMGKIGEQITKTLKINEIPTDPKTGDKYIYATTLDLKKYQIAGTLETDMARLNIITQTYADNGTQKAKVIGNHKEDVIYDLGNTGTYYTIVPSMIYDIDSGTNILNSTGILSIVNKKGNIPYDTGNGKNNTKKAGELIKELRGQDAEIVELKLPPRDQLQTMTGGEIIDYWKNNENNSNPKGYSTGTIEATMSAIAGNGTTNYEIIEQIVKGTITSTPIINNTTPTYQDCTFNSTSVPHGTSVTAYLTTSVAYGETCKSEQRTCNDGTLSGTYANTTCTVAGATGTFSLSSTSVQAGTDVTITNNCTTAPTSYTSSNTSVATVSGTTITTLTTGTTDITPVGGACSDSSAKTLTVTTPPLTGWRALDPNCPIEDITIGSQTWAGCNSTLGNGFEWGKQSIGTNGTIGSCYNYDGINNASDADCAIGNTNMASNANPKNFFDLKQPDGTNANSDSEFNTIWGKLYTWDNSSSACPSGRHVPTDAEWTTLENTLAGTTCRTGDGWQCSGLGWNRGGSTSSSNLANRLKIPLAGLRFTDGSAFYNRGNSTFLWSSSESSTDAYNRYLNRYNDTTHRNLYSKAYGFSVRCLKD